MAGFPERRPGVLYLAEGGQETELMYRHGHELPEFAMYPLLDDPHAVADLTAMYTRYLEVAAANGFVALMGGLDYRASHAATRTAGSPPSPRRRPRSGPWRERIRSLRPNASVAEKQPLCSLGHLEAGDPVALGEQMGTVAGWLPHVDVWGGCCGTWDDHLREIAPRVRAASAAA